MTGKPCPDCGIPENMEIHSPETPDKDGLVGLTNCVFTYSCEHYRDICEHPRCRFCGKRDSPVRQVPVQIAFSDCYCDDCAEKARDYFMQWLPKCETCGIPHNVACTSKAPWKFTYSCEHYAATFKKQL
jgi:hypothetical protein